MKEIQGRFGNSVILPPASGRGTITPAAKARTEPLLKPAYVSRPPSTLDFIKDNALPGGGLPTFYVDGELLTYTAPDGFVAVVTDISWYITPQNYAIYPAQLSMRLYVDDAVIQGTDTMGIGQAGNLNNLYIPVKSGAKLSIRLGRGPGMVAYLVTLLQDNGTELSPPLNQNSSPWYNALTSLNGVLYAANCGNDETKLWRSFDGKTWTDLGSGIPQGNGYPVASLLSYQQFLVFWCEDVAFGQPGLYFSSDGTSWAYGGNGAPFEGGPFGTDTCDLFEYNGLITAWSRTNGDLYQTSDFGVTWTPLVTSGLTPGQYYRFTVLNGKLYAAAVYNGGVTPRQKLYRLDGTIWSTVVDLDVAIPSWSGGLGRDGFIFVAFNGSLFLGLGRSFPSSTIVNDLWQSSNGGYSWTAVNNTTTMPGGISYATVHSTLGIVVLNYYGDIPSGTVNLIPAVYNPELRCYAQIKGHLLKSKGTVEETLLNPL